MRHSPFKNRSCTGAFTLVELLAVFVIIAILASLILGVFKYAQEKGARSRAEAEVKSMELALESYKIDNGEYLRTAESVILNPITDGDPNNYMKSGKDLYIALSGDSNGDPTDGVNLVAGAKTYFEFKPNQLATDVNDKQSYPVDPWGYAYGYSTAQAENTDPTKTLGYNPTFDLWSTGGKTGSPTTDNIKWLKNW